MADENSSTIDKTEENHGEQASQKNGTVEAKIENSSFDVVKTDAVDTNKNGFVVKEEDEKTTAMKEGDTTRMEKGDVGTDTPTDEYHWFQVVVKNIPYNIPFTRFRTQICSWLEFDPKKIMYNPKRHYARLALANAEQQNTTVKLLNCRKWNNNKLICKLAAPMEDPLVAQQHQRKRQQCEQDGGEGAKRGRREEEVEEEVDESLPLEDRIVQKMCPYAGKPYEEQLKLKENHIRECMERLTFNMRNQNVGQGWLPPKKDTKDTKSLCLNLLPIVKSPVLNNYRNKVEFFIGTGSDGVGNTVGLRHGSNTKGNVSIIGPWKCPNYTLESIEIAHEFQKFIRELPYPSYNNSTHTGFWHQCVVRTTTTGDAMVIIQAKASSLTEEEVKDAKEKMIEFFTKPVGSVNVSSLYLSTTTNGYRIQHLAGCEQIEEELLGLKFRISPHAFFQVNSRAAEVLYQTIGEWCSVQKDACVLDVFCGTGTIGICLARNCPSVQVIGIEISEQAVSDAQHNAMLNKMANATYVCGSANDVIAKTVKKITAKNIIAVVDPPRAGLSRNVINQLRKCTAIKKLIYVSCSQNQVADSIVLFCRPQCKGLPGAPFRTVRAVPVDLFPHTPHYELVIELQRGKGM